MAVRMDAGADSLAWGGAGLVVDTVSVCGWARLTSLGSTTYDTVVDVGGSGAEFIINYNATIDDFELWVGATYLFSAAPAAGDWFFWALVTNDGADVARAIWSPATSETIYTASAATSANSNVASIYLGSNNSSEYWNGRVAHAKVWAARLTQAEFMREKWSARPCRMANLSSWSPLLVNAKDYSGNGHNWTENGTLTYEDGPPVGWGAAPYVIRNPAAGPGGRNPVSMGFDLR